MPEPTHVWTVCSDDDAMRVTIEKSVDRDQYIVQAEDGERYLAFAQELRRVDA